MWEQFLASPVFGIAVTVVGFALAVLFSRVLRDPAWANPILWASAAIVTLLLIARIDYGQYMVGGAFFAPVLGVAVVALAAPPFRHRRLLKGTSGAIILAVGLGSLVGVVVTVALAFALGGSEQTILSVAPKQATSPVALGVATLSGGSGEMAAVLAVLTGILGATAGPGMLRLLRFDDARSRGLAMGVSAHAIGTARINATEPVAGAFAVVGMVLAALFVTVLVPITFAVVGFVQRL
ncbi:LrgB family protein [Mycetocola manganoxydans]|nr:LrgB family protein [Mycetocola manganoxydans]